MLRQVQQPQQPQAHRLDHELVEEFETMDGLKRIYARNCEVRRIERAVAEPFLQSFHRLGYTRCRHLYGLFVSRGEDISEGTLVAVAGFSAPRVWRKGERASVPANGSVTPLWKESEWTAGWANS